MMAIPSNVKLVKFPTTDEIDQALFEKALDHFLGKVGNGELNLAFKEYAKGGLRVQHEVHGRYTLNGKLFVASDEKWQLLEAIQSVLKKLEKEVVKQSSKS